MIMALGLLCFLCSASLEATLLLRCEALHTNGCGSPHHMSRGWVVSCRYEDHVVLIVASLIIAALLLASCCMGLLVWWKGPEWADDDRDAAAWVHEHRPPQRSAPPEVRADSIAGPYKSLQPSQATH